MCVLFRPLGRVGRLYLHVEQQDESLSKREAQLDIPVLLILDEDAPVRIAVLSVGSEDCGH